MLDGRDAADLGNKVFVILTLAGIAVPFGIISVLKLVILVI